MAKFRTHYDNLKVARNAPDSVIKAAYKALCQKHHPDKYHESKEDAERVTKIINAAYVVLIDPDKRALHDAWIQEQENKAKQESEKAQFHETGKTVEQPYYQQQDKPKSNKRSSSKRGSSKYKPNYNQNDGKPGVVYILDNPALSSDIYKLGQTTRTGHARANDFNKGASTGMPGLYECIFQFETKDCGTAEKLVFKKLDQFRLSTSKTFEDRKTGETYGQEFFRLTDSDLSYAKEVIKHVCREVDEKIRQEEKRKQATAQAEEYARAKARAQAEEEVRAKARAQAEEEVRAKARAQAEEYARAKARAQAEEYARAKARAQAEEEARAKARAQAREETSPPYPPYAPSQQANNSASTPTGWLIAVGILLVIVFFSDKPQNESQDNPSPSIESSTIQQIVEPVAPPVKTQKIKVVSGKPIKIFNECEEEIYVALANSIQQQGLISRGVVVKPFANTVTTLMVDSNSIFVYAYSKSHTWKGDEKTGLKVDINSTNSVSDRSVIDNEENLLGTWFFPYTMTETGSDYQVGFTCEKKSHHINNKKAAKKKSVSAPNRIANNIPPQENYSEDSINADKIFRLSEEAKKLSEISRINKEEAIKWASIARKKEEEHQKLLHSLNSVKTQAKTESSSILEYENRKAIIAKAIREQQRVARYQQQRIEHERSESFKNLKVYGR